MVLLFCYLLNFNDTYHLYKRFDINKIDSKLNSM